MIASSQHAQSTSPVSPRKIMAFRQEIWGYYRRRGRMLPWRETTEPYRVVVSEVMLQQTRVERVIPFYERFLERFPDVFVLAESSRAEVLREWQGLGYNRRAKMLHDTARVVARERQGQWPRDAGALRTLPGVGPYTACAVAAFAFNEPVVMVETNIRTVFLHRFFKDRTSVADREIIRYIVRTLDRENPREWYFALMDYGAHLKQNGVRCNGRSAHYTRQGRFEGSGRQLRGQILRLVSEQSGVTFARVRKASRRSTQEVQQKLEELVSEGFLKKQGRRYIISD